MQRILLVRHDKIGDFVLTWPAFYLMRTAFPEARIDVLVARGMESFANLCPYIDDVISDGDDAAVTAMIVERRYDAAIALHSQWRICKIFRDARVPYTLGPKLNWYQYFYKERTSAKYRKGEPCWRGNCMIVEYFIRRHGLDIPAVPPRLWDNAAEIDYWGTFYGRHGDEKLIFVHAGTGGSSGSLPLEGFVDLLKTIRESTSIQMKILLTYSGKEESLASKLRHRLETEGVAAELARPLDDLADFARSLVAADLFIAGSTGPIHLAGLHDVPTVGFYAGRRSRPDIRWQTLTRPGKRLSFTPPIGRRTGRNMALVDTRKAGTEVAKLLKELYS